MGGRVVEGSGLENRQTGNRLVGSNPTPSAICCSGVFRRSPEKLNKQSCLQHRLIWTRSTRSGVFRFLRVGRKGGRILWVGFLRF